MTALARAKHEKWNKGKKANVWICGFDPLPSSKETKCEDCGSLCYYTNDASDLIAKKHKKICGNCALKKGILNEEQRHILEKTAMMSSID